METGPEGVGSLGESVAVEDRDTTGPVPPRHARADGGRRAPSLWRHLAVDAAVLSGLAGVAITQPVLDLFGNNPTFFVAGAYGRGQIVAFALVVAFVPAVVVFALTGLPRLASARAGTVAHGLGVAFFAGLVGLVVCSSAGIDGVWTALLVAGAMAAGVAVLEHRWRAGRQFLSYLALGNVAFLALFGLSSPTAELLRGDSYADAGNVRIPAIDGPVVVIVLDEFPLTSLLRADGTINDVRYPNLAGLAGESTWFRNAASESRTTYISVPSILTGLRAEPGDLPTYREHPRNLFTLLGSTYPVNRYEVVTDLCPPDVCARPEPQSVGQALDDAGVVYRHRALPAGLRQGLPDIDRSWGNFGGDVGGATVAQATSSPPTSSGSPDPMARLDDVPEDESGKVGQAAVVRRQTRLIDATPSVNFVHVLVPHHPYELTPWGAIASDTWIPATLPEPGDPGYDEAYRELYQLQALQIGAVDELIGGLVDQLKATGAWDDALLVVMSDHGIDITPPEFTRTPSADNSDELFRIPLFVKAPGQTEGETRDDPASTVDVLPSIVDLLGIDAEWSFEGHSLFDGSEPTIDRLVTSDVDAAAAVAARHTAQFPRGDDWTALAAVGEGEDLVGDPVASHRRGDPSPLRWSHGRRDLLADLSTSAGSVPYLLRGTVSGTSDEPPELVVALNGTLAGTIGGYSPDEDGWAFHGFMAPFFRDGPNEVVAYQVERTDDGVILHEVAST